MTRRSVRNLDWTMVFCIFSLLGIGLLILYSASQVPALPGRSGVFSRQILWMGIGLGVMLAFTVIPFRIWEEYSHFFYVAALVLLLLIWGITCVIIYQAARPIKMTAITIVTQNRREYRLSFCDIAGVLLYTNHARFKDIAYHRRQE